LVRSECEGEEGSTREAAAMRGAACCASRSGLARVFALRAPARGASRGLASGDARAHAWRACVGVPCAWEWAVRLEMGRVGSVGLMCALPVRRAHRERADLGNARIARSTVRVWEGGGRYRLNSPWAPGSEATGARFPHGRPLLRFLALTCLERKRAHAPCKPHAEGVLDHPIDHSGGSTCRGMRVLVGAGWLAGASQTRMCDRVDWSQQEGQGGCGAGRA